MKKKIFDWKDKRSWNSVVKRGLTKCLGRSYVKTLKTNADSIEYVDSEDEGCTLFEPVK